MQQELQRSAIDASAVRGGVTNDPVFETISAQIHGFGLNSRTRRIPELSGPAGAYVVLPTIQRPAHDLAICEDHLCAHPDHGLSTAGPSFDANERAGQRTPNLGDPARESRTYHPLNEYVADFSIDEAVVGPQYREPDAPIMLGDSVKNLMRASIEPDRRGGGSSGRKRNDGTSPDFGALPTWNSQIARYVGGK